MAAEIEQYDESMYAALNNEADDISLSDIMRASADRFRSLCDNDFIEVEYNTKRITFDIIPVLTFTPTPLQPQSNSTNTFLRAAKGISPLRSTNGPIPTVIVDDNEHPNPIKIHKEAVTKPGIGQGNATVPPFFAYICRETSSLKEAADATTGE